MFQLPQLRGRDREILLDEGAAYTAILDRETVRRAVDAFGDPDARTLSAQGLYAILVLEVWLTSFLPRALSAEVMGSAAA